jgi:hypothetical protein
MRPRAEVHSAAPAEVDKAAENSIVEVHGALDDISDARDGHAGRKVDARCNDDLFSLGAVRIRKLQINRRIGYIARAGCVVAHVRRQLDDVSVALHHADAADLSRHERVGQTALRGGMGRRKRRRDGAQESEGEEGATHFLRP